MSPAFDGSIHEIFSTLKYGAQIILKDGVDALGHLRAADAAMLKDHIRNQVPHYAILRFIIVVPSFPLIPAGKVDYKPWQAKTIRLISISGKKGARPHLSRFYAQLYATFSEFWKPQR